jgi:Family of unknown function (DUF6788)
MAHPMGDDPAALRQLIGRTERQRTQQLQVLLSTRQRLVRGSFVVLGKKCGKAGCACTRGGLHATRYLSASEQGRTRMVYVSAAEAATVKTAAERYQRFRRARAQLVKLSTRTVVLADRLQQALTEPVAAPAARRQRSGRPPEQRGGGDGGRKRGGRGRAGG